MGALLEALGPRESGDVFGAGLGQGAAGGAVLVVVVVVVMVVAAVVAGRPRFCLPHSPPQTESQEIYQNTTKIQHCPVLPSPISKRRFARIFYLFIYFLAKSHVQILSHLISAAWEGVAGRLFVFFFFGALDGGSWTVGFDSWLEG